MREEPWFKMKHSFAFHHKILSVGNACAGAFLRAIAACHAQNTGGKIPDSIQKAIAPNKNIWDKLAAAGLVVVVDGEMFLSDFYEENPNFSNSSHSISSSSNTAKTQAERAKEYRLRRMFGKGRHENRHAGVTETVTERHEPSRDANECFSIEEKRREEKEIESRHFVTKRDVTDSEAEVTEVASDEASSPSLPPTPSSPPPSPRETAKRGTRLKPEWTPDASTLEALVAEGHTDPMRCLPSFRDYWTSTPGQRGLKLDWDATFRNWVRNDKAMKKPLFESKFDRDKRLRQGAGEDPMRHEWFRNIQEVF